MVDFKNNWRVAQTFCIFEEMGRFQQIDWFLIIELYHLISKNQKLFFTFSYNKNFKVYALF